MAGNFSRPTIGLADLLQWKNNGQQPSTLADYVQPVWEWLPWVLGNLDLTILQDTVAPATASQGAFIFPNIVIPQNEIWFLRGYTIEAFATGADAFNVIRPAIVSVAGGVNRPFAASSQALTVTGAGVTSGCIPFDFSNVSPSTFLMRSAARFGFTVGTVVNAAASFLQANVAFHRLLAQ